MKKDGTISDESILKLIKENAEDILEDTDLSLPYWKVECHGALLGVRSLVNEIKRRAQYLLGEDV